LEVVGSNDPDAPANVTTVGGIAHSLGAMAANWGWAGDKHRVSLDPRAHLAERTDHQTLELARTPTRTLPQARASVTASHDPAASSAAPSINAYASPGPHQVHTHRADSEPA
ncbi:hypothetical protein BD779DRAFT_1476171, partial [Infundibulicybe gibba]